MSEPLSKQELHHLLGVSVTDSHITRAVYINELEETPNKMDVLDRYIDIHKKAKEYHKTTLEYAKKAGFVNESLASSILEDKSWMPDINIIQNWYNNCTEEDCIDKLLVSAHSHILHASLSRRFPRIYGRIIVTSRTVTLSLSVTCVSLFLPRHWLLVAFLQVQVTVNML